MKSKFESFSKRARFKDLIEAAQNCKLCTNLCSRNKILSEANGNIYSKVLFIAEAPGRLGADKTGIPLYGDRTGDNFENLLGNIGWKRQDIFITNAVLCNPRKTNGNNATPSTQEIENCSFFLEMVIQLIDPVIIVSLGATALKALKDIFNHELILAHDVGNLTPWAGKLFFPLYHPGPRAIIHRSSANQTSDFMKLAKIIDPIKGLKKQKSETNKKRNLQPFVSSTPLQNLICTVIKHIGKTSYFKLNKLLYLIDLESLSELGHTITGEIYIRQEQGPWPPSLKKEIAQLKDREISFDYFNKMPFVRPGPSPRFSPDMGHRELEIVSNIIDRFGKKSNNEIKSSVYRTKPMRDILKEEKKGKDMQNTAVIYKDRLFPETY
jgi:uracil-DNA glycosylase family 4